MKTILLGVVVLVGAAVSALILLRYQPEAAELPISTVLRPDRAAEERFRQFDENGDGVVTRDEVPRAAFFDDLDANGDERVTLEETQAYINRWRGGDAKGNPGEWELSVPAQVDRDLSYLAPGQPSEARRTLDLYRPQTSGPHPLLILIHGGGWTIGDKGHRSVAKHKVERWLPQGWAVASINYRLSPAVLHPAHIEDVGQAIAWLQSQAETYEIDPTRVVLLGHSAGAHLAVLAASAPSYIERAEGDPAGVIGVISLDTAALDIERNVDAFASGPRTAEMFLNAFGEDRAKWRDASPIRHLSEANEYPTMLLIHAGDRVASRVLGETFAERLIQFGGSAELFHAKDRDHGSLNRELGVEGDPATAKIDAFLAQLQDSRQDQE